MTKRYNEVGVPFKHPPDLVIVDICPNGGAGPVFNGLKKWAQRPAVLGYYPLNAPTIQKMVVDDMGAKACLITDSEDAKKREVFEAFFMQHLPEGPKMAVAG